METPPGANEELFTCHQDIIAALRRSHRLSVQMFYFQALLLPLVILVGIIFSVMENSPTSFIPNLISYLIIIACCGPGAARSSKEQRSFLRWGKVRVPEMNESVPTAQLVQDLQTYFMRLLKAAYAGTLWGSPNNKPPARLLKEFRRRQNVIRCVVIAVIGFLVAFILWVGGQNLTILLGVSIIPIILMVAILSIEDNWARSVVRWARAYVALDQQYKRFSFGQVWDYINDDALVKLKKVDDVDAALAIHASQCDLCQRGKRCQEAEVIVINTQDNHVLYSNGKIVNTDGVPRAEGGTVAIRIDSERGTCVVFKFPRLIYLVAGNGEDVLDIEGDAISFPLPDSFKPV